jgi:hypothetical protein
VRNTFDYLDTVTSAGYRSRAIISVVLLLLVFTLTSLRNNYDPAWNYTLIQVYEDLRDCLVQKTFDDPKCTPLKERIEQFEGRPAQTEDVINFAENVEIELTGKYGDPNFLTLNETKIKEIESRYNALIAKDATSDAISIPFFGSIVDYNDLWLVSGVIMIFLLSALYLSLEQERRNAKYIFDRKHSYWDLVVMNQVLWVRRPRLFAKILLSVVWLMPTFLYLYLFYSDLDTYDLSVITIGRSRSNLEYFLEGATVALVVYTNLICLLSLHRLRRLIAGVAD